MAPYSIPPGSDYGTEISPTTRECDGFVLVLSTSSQESLWVHKEVDFTLSNRKPIIPVYIDKSDIADAFNFRLSNIQRIEAFEKASDAYEILIGRLKALAPDDRNSAKQWNQTSVTNAHVATNTVVRTNVCPISFNTMPGKEYISAKETNPELQYRHGPIKINGEDSYWILTTVNNMCPDGNMIARMSDFR